VCEKAIAKYLETKRMAFPRFYFLSPADLLDILSKGRQPREVVLLKVRLSVELDSTLYNRLSISLSQFES